MPSPAIIVVGGVKELSFLSSSALCFCDSNNQIVLGIYARWIGKHTLSSGQQLRSGSQ
ncbi:hypothetical protein [Caudoviricetes sp.]|nr:hypothetical protein [Caudoviricetes sp.]